MILVDTNHLDVLMGSGPRTDRLFARLIGAPDDEISTTIVDVQEKVQGWLAKIRMWDNNVPRQVPYYELFGQLLTFFGDWRVMPFDAAAATRFEELRKRKLGVGPMDLK